MSFVRRRSISFAFEDMPKMTTAFTAHDFRAAHAKSAISMPRDSTGYAIEVCRPTAAALELVRCLVKRGVAAGAGVDASGRHVLVVLAGVWGLGTLFAEYAKLL